MLWGMRLMFSITRIRPLGSSNRVQREYHWPMSRYVSAYMDRDQANRQWTMLKESIPAIDAAVAKLEEK
jgi:hypothetical protein